MPDGRREPDYYNPEWCRERHEKNEKKFAEVWAAIRRQYSMLWGILAGQLVIMGGIIAVLITVTFFEDHEQMGPL